MKLYEVDQAIDDLINSSIDTETGEILIESAELSNRLNTLQIERQRILEYLAKLVLNSRSEASAIREEESRLKARRDQLAKKENHLMHILDRECNGEKTDLGIATFSYRKTSHLEVSDPEKAVSWLKSHRYQQCYRIPDPEISKTEVRKLVNAGTAVPGCSVVEERSFSLK